MREAGERIAPNSAGAFQTPGTYAIGTIKVGSRNLSLDINASPVPS